MKVPRVKQIKNGTYWCHEIRVYQLDRCSIVETIIYKIPKQNKPQRIERRA